MFGPVVVAAGTVVVFRDWSYALIAVLTPVMLAGNFAEERTRGRLSLRRGMREFAAGLDKAREELAARRAWQAGELRAASPDPAEVLYRAKEPGLRLWERRPGAPDFLKVAAGTADQSWSPPAEPASGEVAGVVRAVVAEASVLPQVPVVVDLSGGGVVGLEGDRDTALAAARAMLCAAVVCSGPADLNVAVFADADRIGAWDWTKWLAARRRFPVRDGAPGSSGTRAMRSAGGQPAAGGAGGRAGRPRNRLGRPAQARGARRREGGLVVDLDDENSPRPCLRRSGAVFASWWQVAGFEPT